jgi:TolA-binding protein
MAFLRRWLLMICVLALGGGQMLAAGSREERAYTAAMNAFHGEMWDRAEAQFARFVARFPNSTNVPQARLLQAQAEFKQQAYANAIGLLTTNLPAAGGLADQYAFWIGEAQFQNADFSRAAATFSSFAKVYPESPLQLRAVVEAASALKELGKWNQTVALLQENNGVFQRAMQSDPGNELVARGELLLAQAKFALKDFGSASAVLEAINPQTLSSALDWQRIYLLCQVKLAAGETDAALVASTNLLQAVRRDHAADLAVNLPASLAMRADILEKLGRTREALAVNQETLTNGAPVEILQPTILKIAGLASSLNQFSDATNALANFLVQFSNSPAADIALLTLGELQLKADVADPADTNQLASAHACFDQFLATFPDSPLAGKAHLDRGWCFWLAGKIPESLADFQLAVEKLPLSEELAVAKFKLGDALFAQTNYPDALDNYLAVWEDFTNFPAVAQTMGEPALYQSLRANLALTNLESASNVLAQIQKNYAGGSAQTNALLFGERWAELRSPSGAREQFSKITEQFPDSPLRPQVSLAVAHTYELEKNWPAVITNYAGWLADFPTNALRPQVTYALAQANYQAGDKTNALQLFTNFIALYPTSELAPAAQWWVADYFFGLGDWANAERNYKAIFQNPDWRNSRLFWESQMMAGRAAVARLGYSDALGYFTVLANDTNCPADLELAVPARFAYGSTLMLMNSTDTNNPLANFQLATNASAFGKIVQDNPTNEWGARAMIEIGNCDLQMNNLDAATNAFAQVLNSPFAGISTRSQAQVGFGIVLEKKAVLFDGEEQQALLKLALDNYVQVFEENKYNLEHGLPADEFWMKKAGLQAAPLVGLLYQPGAQKMFYLDLEGVLPQLKETFEKKIAALSPENK